MNIAIQSNGLVLTESLRAYVYRRMETSLGWALTRKLAVWLSDINGPRGGRDKRCKIALQLVGGKVIVIEDTEPDMYLAIDRATARAARALVRSLARGREVKRATPPHKRAAGGAGMDEGSAPSETGTQDPVPARRVRAMHEGRSQ